MKIFIGRNCPKCEALKARVPLDAIPRLEVLRLPDSAVPTCEDDVNALGDADLYEVQSVPALVLSTGAVVRDYEEILGILKRAAAAAGGYG